MIISQSLFSEKTWNEFLEGGKILHHAQRTTLPSGTYILLQTPEGLAGIAQLTTFSDTGNVCRESHPLDADTYTEQDAKYNTYEIATKVLKIYERPIPYSELIKLFGIDNKQRNNITKMGQMSFRKLFYHGPNRDEVMTRVQCWLRLMLW